MTTPNPLIDKLQALQDTLPDDCSFTEGYLDKAIAIIRQHTAAQGDVPDYVVNSPILNNNYTPEEGLHSLMGDASARKDEESSAAIAPLETAPGVPIPPLALSSEIPVVDERFLKRKIAQASHHRDMVMGLKANHDDFADAIYTAIKPYLRTTEPVMVSLEKCSDATGLPYGDIIRVLNAAGVQHVD